MSRLLLICAVPAAALVLISMGQIERAPTSAYAGSYYHKCGVFKYKGRHALFAHSLSCRKAKHKARYVLKHRHRPPHWKCSLAELSSGFAACHTKKRAWEFVPA